MHIDYRLIGDLHTGVQRLLLHAGGKGSARFMRLEGGVVGDGGHLADDATHLGLFQDQGLLAAADRIDTSADTGRACTDD